MYGSNPVTVSTYVIVQESCPLTFDVMGGGQVEVTCGSPRDGFQFVVATEALREFVKLGSQALDEMDALPEQEKAEEHCELATAGERSA